MMMMKMKMNKHFLFYAVSHRLQQVVQCNQALILFILWMCVYDTFTRVWFAALIWWNGAGTFLHVYFPTVASYYQGSDLTKSWFPTLVWWNRAGTFFPACCILQLLQGTIKVFILQKQVCILCGVQSLGLSNLQLCGWIFLCSSSCHHLVQCTVMWADSLLV